MSGPYEQQAEGLQAIENELLDVANRKARVMEAYDVDDFTKRITPLRKTEADLKRRLADTAKDTEHQTAVLAKPEEIILFTSHVADFIKHSDPKERKQMLNRFITSVTIRPDTATVEYRIPLPMDAKRPGATKLVLALDEPVPPIARVTPHARG